jgi:Trk K+ transport system NAD-binding subunit
MTIDPDEAHYDAINNADERLRRLRRRRRPWWRLALAGIYDFFQIVREARVALVGFALLGAVNAAYLINLYDYTAADLPPFTIISALYETMKMMTLETDLPIPEGDLLGDILFFVTPILGLALVFQSILNFGRFILDKGSRREDWQIALARTYSNHVIVCGLGSVTYRVILDLLEAGYGVVAIERDWSSEYLESTIALGVPVIHGDARKREALVHAGIFRARSLVAGLNDDLANIEIGLAVRRRRPELPIILRIFNEELDRNLEQTFGRNAAFSASALAAPTLAAAALGRSIAHLLPLPPEFTYEDGTPRFKGVLQLTITPGSEFVGSLEQLEERMGLRALLHLKARRNNNGARLRGHRDRLEPGDIVALLGPLSQLEQARRLNHGYGAGNEIDMRSFSQAPLPGASRAFDTVIVCGLGKIGYRVVHALALMRPQPRIVLICREEDTFAPLIEEVRPLVAAIFTGDGRKVALLRQAEIDRACAVVAVTSDDLTNLQIGLAARRIVPDIDMVLRVTNEDLAAHLEMIFGAHTTFSVAGLAAPTLAAAAVVRGIDYAVEVGEHILSTTTVRVRPGDELDGRSVADIRAGQGMLVIVLRRAGETVTPNLTTRLQAGDEVAVLVDIGRLERLRAGDRQFIEPALQRRAERLSRIRR